MLLYLKFLKNIYIYVYIAYILICDSFEKGASKTAKRNFLCTFFRAQLEFTFEFFFSKLGKASMEILVVLTFCNLHVMLN